MADKKTRVRRTADQLIVAKFADLQKMIEKLDTVRQQEIYQNIIIKANTAITAAKQKEAEEKAQKELVPEIINSGLTAEELKQAIEAFKKK